LLPGGTCPGECGDSFSLDYSGGSLFFIAIDFN
jgi:hypothetical protein